MSEVRQTKCTAHGCTLSSVMCDLCLFHAGIERNLWPFVTKYLQSPEGEEIVKASLGNRMLWAMGVDVEKVEYWPPKSEDEKSEFCFNSHDRALMILTKLSRYVSFPPEVDLKNREKTIDQLNGIAGHRVYLDEYQATLSLDWMCATYEQVLIDHVKKRVEKDAGVKRNLREEDEKRQEALSKVQEMINKLRHSY